MAVDRERIWSRFFERLQTIPGIVTFSRKLKGWDAYDPAEYPVLCVAQGNETPTVDNRGLPPKWTLEAELYLYLFSEDEQEPPVIQRNLYVKLIEEALEATLAETSPAGAFPTLGGLVSHCRISGTIQTDEGNLGDHALAIIPVQIVTT